jgi:hypothetical protein
MNKLYLFKVNFRLVLDTESKDIENIPKSHSLKTLAETERGCVCLKVPFR